MDVNNNNRKRYTFSSDAVGCEVNEDTSDEQEMSSPWQTVDRRRARSLDSAQPAPSKKTGHRGQAPVKKITVTAKKPSNMAQNAAERRHEATKPCHKTLVESRQEGPSRPKGKNTDPREWGDVHLDEHEMDVDTQQAAYESYKEQSQYADRHKRRGCRHRFNVGRELSQRWTRPLELRPVCR